MPLFKPAGSTHLEPSQQFIRELRRIRYEFTVEWETGEWEYRTAIDKALILCFSKDWDQIPKETFTTSELKEIFKSIMYAIRRRGLGPREARRSIADMLEERNFTNTVGSWDLDTIWTNLREAIKYTRDHYAWHLKYCVNTQNEDDNEPDKGPVDKGSKDTSRHGSHSPKNKILRRSSA
jgi:hypothetical protein